jgi:AcrR family transcriptional regulator
MDGSQRGHPVRSLQWIRPPRQARTQESLERLLDVAEVLLRDKEFDDVHVRDIAERADTSVAAFYRRFKDKDALLHALHERSCEAAFATADDALCPERWAGADIAEILRAVFPLMMDVLRLHESLYRAIYQRAIGDAAMRERSIKVNRYVIDRLSDLLLARAEEIRHPEPRVAVRFALVQSIALLVQLYTVGIRDLGGLPANDDRLAGELAASCLAYLGIVDPPTPH